MKCDFIFYLKLQNKFTFKARLVERYGNYNVIIPTLF